MLLLVLAAGVVAVIALRRPAIAQPSGASLDLAAPSATPAFAHALEPVPLTFPRDHGAHLEFQTEWWYFTGNLTAQDGRRFGYQLTIFRRGLEPGPAQRVSDLASNDLYFAHFALTDPEAGEHRAFQRFSRGAQGLAGAATDGLRVYLEDWTIEAAQDSIQLNARQDDLQLALSLLPQKPPVAQGEDGLSRKGEQPGNASYYVSITDLASEGNLSVGGQQFQVRGESWFDHEWGTSALGPEAVGWDWFGLQLDDGRDLMLFQIRTRAGGIEPVSGGTVIYPDGSSRRLTLEDMQLTTAVEWTSKQSGADYPVGWQVSIPSEQLELQVDPLLPDQENRLGIVYWEGAVTVSGTESGVGYLELTGYGTGIQGIY